MVEESQMLSTESYSMNMVIDGLLKTAWSKITALITL